MSRENRELRRSLEARIRQCADEISALRREANPARDVVVALAERLGRKFHPKKRGEPAYKNEWFDLRTLFIPNKSPLRQGTAHNILNQLEEDLAAMRHKLEDLGGPIDGS